MTGENRKRLVTAAVGTWGPGWIWLANHAKSQLDGFVRVPIQATNPAPGLVSIGWPIVGGAIVVLIVVAIVLRRFERRPGSAREPSETDQPILTDRERVLGLLDGNGGRMKQSQIVDSVEWSKAKVSRLLAELEADEEIIKLRLGRENLICRPGYEPKASRAPRADGVKSADSTHKSTDESLSDE